MKAAVALFTAALGETRRLMDGLREMTKEEAA